MFGINGGELIVLVIIAIIVVGPERMPEYARQLREWVVGMRSVVERGREQLKEEVGDDVDWASLDPRQYDPRRIVREALYEPGSPATASNTVAPAVTASTVVAPAIADAPGASSAAHAAPASHDGQAAPRAPFDSEAT